MTIAVEAERRALGSSPRLARAMTRIATVGDQLLVAISNFGLTLSISRAYGAEEIAGYGIGLSLALLILGLQRQAITIPLALQNPSRVLRRRGGIFAQHLLVLGIVLM